MTIAVDEANWFAKRRDVLKVYLAAGRPQAFIWEEPEKRDGSLRQRLVGIADRAAHMTVHANSIGMQIRPV